jgi:DNA uptake protein and related DNA-binding proteins
LQSRVVNVNTASVFELMTVCGLNQELAANVFHYREKKGPFQKIEDLIKVSGISFELPNFTLLCIILMKI